MDNQPTSLLEAIRYLSDRDVCLDFIVKLRWPNGVTCPTCDSTQVHFLAKRKLWVCKNKHARQQFSVKVGTIFEDSPIGLDKWLPAIWLIASAKNGISSYELSRSLLITQKSAWFMLHRIRFAMHRGSFEKANGTVEVDETFSGGKARFMDKNRRDQVIKGTGGEGKAIVVGILERHSGPGHSTVRASVVTSRRKGTLQSHVRENVEPGSSVYTDAFKSYEGLHGDYLHEAIDHAEKYVDGTVHTNGLENFWSLLKRAIHGTYVSVEPFHLFRYIDEEAFRFNTRQMEDSDRFADVLQTAAGRRLTYRELTGMMSVP